MHQVTISNAVTTSLEALALWIVYNYEDKWSTEGTTRESPAKFTGMTKGNRIYSGWNTEGITKFNEFIAFVRNNREQDDGNFEEMFKNKMLQEHEDLLIKRNKHVHTENIVCHNDLDTKIASMSGMIYHSEQQHIPSTCNIPGISDTASTVSQSSVSAASFHSVQNYSASSNGASFEAV